jgi:hypothetical protein
MEEELQKQKKKEYNREYYLLRKVKEGRIKHDSGERVRHELGKHISEELRQRMIQQESVIEELRNEIEKAEREIEEDQESIRDLEQEIYDFLLKYLQLFESKHGQIYREG